MSEPEEDSPNRCQECGAEIPDEQIWCGYCSNFDEFGPED